MVRSAAAAAAVVATIVVECQVVVSTTTEEEEEVLWRACTAGSRQYVSVQLILTGWSYGYVRVVQTRSDNSAKLMLLSLPLMVLLRVVLLRVVLLRVVLLVVRWHHPVEEQRGISQGAAIHTRDLPRPPPPQPPQPPRSVQLHRWPVTIVLGIVQRP